MMKRSVVLRAALRLVKRRDSGKRTFVPPQWRYWHRPDVRFLSAREAHCRYRIWQPSWEVWIWPKRRVEQFREGESPAHWCIIVLVDNKTGIAKDVTYH